LSLVEELENLRNENKRLKEDQEILKKSLAYFAAASLKDISLSKQIDHDIP
jgi:transposase-like protein